METFPVGELVDSRPARLPERVTLEGRFVRLEPLDAAAHGASIYEGAHGPGEERLWTYMSDGPYADRETFDRALEKKAESKDPLFFAVVDRATEKAKGYASYMRIEPAHRVIEVGNILYTPALQRTPGATEAMYLMARHAFEELGYRRYEWKCNALNAPSRAAALRLGFQFEGIFRQHMIIKGRNRDTAWFAMLDADWPQCKAAFEKWLEPGNFDESGRQRVSLAELR